MRLVVGLVAVLWLVAQSAPPVLADNEIVLDDDAPSVQMHGTWATSASTSGFLGSGYHYRVAGDGSSTFTWPFAGGYAYSMTTMDKAKNKAQDVKGRAKEAVGRATNNRDLKNKGKTDQAKSAVKDVGEKAKDAVGQIKRTVKR